MSPFTFDNLAHGGLENHDAFPKDSIDLVDVQFSSASVSNQRR